MIIVALSFTLSLIKAFLPKYLIVFHKHFMILSLTAYFYPFPFFLFFVKLLHTPSKVGRAQVSYFLVVSVLLPGTTSWTFSSANVVKVLEHKHDA